MRGVLKLLRRRAHLVGYAVLLAITVTLALALVGPSALADSPRPAKASKTWQTDRLSELPYVA